MGITQELSGDIVDALYGNITLSALNPVASMADIGPGSIAALLTGFVVGSNTAILATDSVLSAFGKVQAQSNNKVSNVLNSANIFVGNGSNIATGVALSGDATITNLGVITVSNLAITNAKIANSTIDLTTKVTGVLPAVNGGTGQSVFIIGDLLQANTTTTLARLAAVATGNVLISGGIGAVSTWGKVGLTTHVSGILPIANGGTGVSAAPASILSTPANPTGTNSTTGLMMGLGIAITPATTGKLKIIVTGAGSNTLASDGYKATIRYGTGAAPVNGAALVGTISGSGTLMTRAQAANVSIPFTIQGMPSGLTVGTTYWIDVSISAVTGGGTASIGVLTITVTEG